MKKLAGRRLCLLALAGLICFPIPQAAAGDRPILATRPGLPDRIGALAAGDFNQDSTCFGGDKHGQPCETRDDCLNDIGPEGGVCDVRVDILAANFEAQDFSWFQAVDNGRYVEKSPSPFVTLPGPNFLTTGDLNNDGDLDVVIVSRLGLGVSVRLSDPDLGFRATPSLFSGSTPQDAVITDFNGDSNQDLVVTSQENDAIFIFSGRGNGEFTFLRSIVTRTADQELSNVRVGPVGIAAADFNCDGLVDLAVSQRDADNVVVLIGNGNGTFQTPVDAVPGVGVGRNPTHIVLARLNDDIPGGNCTADNPDLVVLLEGGQRRYPDPSLPVDVPGGAALLLGGGSGTFSLGVPIVVAPPSRPLGLAAGSLGGGAAGFDDLVLTHFENDQILIYRADGVGGYGPPISIGPGAAASTVKEPTGVALLDRDGNGIRDRIVVSNFGAYNLTVFDFAGTCATGPKSGQACSRDQECCTFDQTCDPGICADTGAFPPFVESLPLSPVSRSRDPVGMALRNLDSGPAEDLVVLSDGEAPVLTVYSGINDGFFFKYPGLFLPVGSGPTALTLADLTGDNRTDVAIALTDADGSAGGGSAPGIAVLEGNGNGEFGAGTCVGGLSAGNLCSSDAFCAGGFCEYAFGRCTGGAGETPCQDDNDCPGQTCQPHHLLSGLATFADRLLATELNPDDSDLDGVEDLSDNCPSLYNPGFCQGGANDGLPCGANDGVNCDTAVGCPNGICKQADLDTDGIGDACDTAADRDGDGIQDQDDNCVEIYNPVQADIDTNRVGDECDGFPDLVALEPAGTLVTVFLGRPGGQFVSCAVSLQAPPVAMEVGQFTSGDSHLDLLVATNDQAGKGAFEILAGNGSGSFSPQPEVLAGSDPRDLEVLELNGNDLDRDGLGNQTDNCPTIYNDDQADRDNDGIGDACSEPNPDPNAPDRGFDEDGDGVDSLDEVRVDNCPDTANSQILVQRDTDSDGIGDACDDEPFSSDPGGDQDGDGIANGVDNCPTIPNPNQENLRGTCSGVPGTCVPCSSDADCPATAICQAMDDKGDACDSDDSESEPTVPEDARDGVFDLFDNCPTIYNPPSFSSQLDTDADGIGDACDNNPCIFVPTDDQDGDGILNDGDGSNRPGDNPCHGGSFTGCDDNCPTRYNPAQGDASGFGVGDDCDELTDVDQDFRLTAILEKDNCPQTYNPDQTDFNSNGIGDACENLLDAVVVDAGNAPGEVIYFVQFPAGSLVESGRQSVGTGPNGIDRADINVDGEDDLLVSNGGDSTLTVLIGKGDGTFLPDPAETDPAVLAIFTIPTISPPEGAFVGPFVRDPVIQDFPDVASLSRSLHGPITLVNVITERADIVGSGGVHHDDLSAWSKGFALVRGNPGYKLEVDINLDGVIDGFDLAFITAQYGRDFTGN